MSILDGVSENHQLFLFDINAEAHVGRKLEKELTQTLPSM